MGESGRELVRIVLANADRSSGGVFSAVAGFAMLVFGATGVVAQLQEALNVVWGVEPAGGGVKGFIRKRVLSFGVVLGAGLLLLVSLGFGAAVSFIAGLIDDSLGHAGLVLRLMDVGSSLVLFTGLFAFMFKFLPDAVIAWRDVGVGALVTAVLLVIGKFLIGIYLGASSTASTYGAFGTLVVVLIWIYYSAQTMFLGAEFTQVYARLHGSRIVPEEHARWRPGRRVLGDKESV
ncbi:MAG: YihY/virulence factor BrkB family protein [Thermoleophilia bacterium]